MAILWATNHLERGPALRIGLGFAIGSVCFLVGPFPGFVELVGAEADAVVFFVGSLFFTAAALAQALQSEGSDRLPSLIQFAGTIYFNVDTFRAVRSAFSDSQLDRLIWAPEAVGSVCFLLSGVIAYRSVRAAGHTARSTGVADRCDQPRGLRVLRRFERRLVRRPEDRRRARPRRRELDHRRRGALLPDRLGSPGPARLIVSGNTLSVTNDR